MFSFENLRTLEHLDYILTNKWLGIPIFAVVMFAVFWISQVGPGVWLADLLTGWLESGQEWVASMLVNDAGELNIWSSILVDGIIDDRIDRKIPSNDKGEVFELFAIKQILKNYNLSQ